MNMHRTAALLALCATLAHAHGIGDRDGHDDHDARPLMVYDANHNVVGEYMPFADTDGTFVSTNGVLVSWHNRHAVIPLLRQFIGTVPPLGQYFDRPASASQFVYGDAYAVGGAPAFTSPDCSGDPVPQWQAGPALAMAYRDGNTVAVYFAGDGPARQVQLLSSRQPPKNDCVAYTQPTFFYAYPIGAKIVITDQHPEPLSIGF
jgi:hypothetical protein